MKNVLLPTQREKVPCAVCFFPQKLKNECHNLCVQNSQCVWLFSQWLLVIRRNFFLHLVFQNIFGDMNIHESTILLLFFLLKMYFYFCVIMIRWQRITVVVCWEFQWLRSTRILDGTQHKAPLWRFSLTCWRDSY